MFCRKYLSVISEMPEKVDSVSMSNATTIAASTLSSCKFVPNHKGHSVICIEVFVLVL